LDIDFDRFIEAFEYHSAYSAEFESQLDQITEQSILNLRKFKEKYRVVKPEVVKLML
jgi:hypothetical protein